jgi:hypothetical protein
MPINIDLLIAAPMLQDYLVDKTGLPMSNGLITCYQDNSRTTLKNWYYQCGTPGSYTYIALPNPLRLSAAGTICDINGVDTIPFFYPYDENDESVSQPYYITIVNQYNTNQITRSNFPYNRSVVVNSTEIENAQNLIVNNGFWRNLQPNYINQTPFTSISLNSYAASNNTVSVIVAPSQHDGFSMPDIQFLKNNITGTDVLTFTPFAASDSAVIVQNNMTYTTPEYYINHSCNSTGSGETQKCYQFPIALHLNNLANIPFTVSIQAQWAGSGSQVIELYLLQYTGTGTSSPNPLLIGGTTITLNSAWTNYTLTDIFPSIVGLALGLGEDDAFYLQVQMPLNTTTSINFTKPALYLTTEAVPVNDIQTYDVVNSIISSPRTGDVRTSVNQFYYYGWLPMNNGLIGRTNPGSNTLYVRANSDTWNLFNLLWSIGKTFDSGSNFNPLFQMYSNTAGTLAATNYGTSAYADYTASSPALALVLPQSMGRVFMGTVPVQALIATNSKFTGYTFTVSASASAGNLLLTFVTNLIGIYQGAPISFTGTLPSAIVANKIYYVILVSSTTFNIATTFANAVAGTAIAYAGGTVNNITANLYPSASTAGEYAHTQLLNEMINHQHDPLFSGDKFMNNCIIAAGTLTSGSGTNVRVTTTTGGVDGYGTQAPFNVTQPATFMNIFIKL